MVQSEARVALKAEDWDNALGATAIAAATRRDRREVGPFLGSAAKPHLLLKSARASRPTEPRQPERDFVGSGSRAGKWL